MGNQSGFPLEQALLGFLMQEPAHGYVLHQRAEEELGRIWYMGISNVYGTLKGLEQAGLVEFTRELQGDYPPRKVYRITPAGQESFLAWVREPVRAIRDMRVEFLAKLYFFYVLGLEGIEELLSAQERFCRDRLERLEQPPSEEARGDFAGLVSDFRRRRIEASLEWLRGCRRKLA